MFLLCHDGEKCVLVMDEKVVGTCAHCTLVAEENGLAINQKVVTTYIYQLSHVSEVYGFGQILCEAQARLNLLAES